MSNRKTLTTRLAAAVLTLASLLLPGCPQARHVSTALSSSSKAYQEYLEDPAALTTIKTIAVFPFANKTGQSGFDELNFSTKLANQLAVHGKVRIIFPRDILAPVARENRESRRHNALLQERIALGLQAPGADVDGAGPEGGGIFSDAPDKPEQKTRPYYNPVMNTDEAVKIARRAKADAVIVGEVSDYDPYMRPRMTVSMRLIATGNTETAAKAIAELTQWGVPRLGSGSGGGAIYIRQEVFDSSIGSVGLDVSRYGRSHFVDDHPYDTEVYLRSMSHFYDVVASELAKAYFDARKKAVKEAEERARAQAKAKNQDQEKAVRRMAALMERDSRIPDFETDRVGEACFDQAFPNRQALLGANNGDRRIQSWRPDGRSIRPPTAAERLGRDVQIPENERGKGLQGYSTMADASFPDADAMMEMNMGDNRDRSWRPDHYNHANPQKSAALYDSSEYRGQ